MNNNKNNFHADGDEKPIPPLVNALPSILSSVGFVWGLYYSFSKKKKFWGYVGYSFLGSIGGGAVGGIIKVSAYPESMGFKKNK